MDNLVRIIMLNVRPGEFIPCLRLLRGVDTASRDHNTPFRVEMSFGYSSNGQAARAQGTVMVRDTNFKQPLDTLFIRTQALAIAAPDPIDPGTQVICNAKVSLQTASGAWIDCSAWETVRLAPTTIGLDG